jgi:D-2-hydroxyacid dehydrogenase (NADP+)
MLQPTVNIVITRPLNLFGGQSLDEKYLRQINSINSRIKITDISAEIIEEISGSHAIRKKVDAVLAEAEILNGFYPPKNLVARASKLKWIHSPLTGVDPFLTSEIVASPIMLTNSRGIHGTQVSELAVTLMLMLVKQSARSLERQKANRWEAFTPDILYHKTVGILGFGVIGKELARLLKSFNMKVMVMESRTIIRPAFVDKILPGGKLKEILSKSDFVVVTLPLTPDTEKLLNEDALRSMKSSAYLINVARGGIVDEKALVRALQERWIAGAGLDVFETEPLPVTSPLWQLPNVIITPHSAGRRPDYDQMATDLFVKNLKKYLAGKPLLNLIDKTKGF